MVILKVVHAIVFNNLKDFFRASGYLFAVNESLYSFMMGGRKAVFLIFINTFKYKIESFYHHKYNNFYSHDHSRNI
jgi:hypothetical protein